jgi:peptidoglycan/xylan/chitin deacetylase (PgdA/CDA1 family)
VVSEVKDWAVTALTTPGVRASYRPWTVRRTPILMLHRFSGSDGVPGRVSRSFLEKCAVWIARSGLRPMTLAAWCRSTVAGEWPTRSICLTVDDGYFDFKEVAFPVLREHGIPATVFVASRFIEGSHWYWWDRVEFAFSRTTRRELVLAVSGRPLQFLWTSPSERAAANGVVTEELKTVPEDVKWSLIREIEQRLEVEIPERPVAEYRGMSWDDLRELSAQGIEFGGHTANHPVLSQVSDDRAAREVAEGIESIERQTGVRPTTFAYPNGRMIDFTPAVVKALRENGIIGAVVGMGGVASPKDLVAGPDAMYRIPRVGMPDEFPRFVQFVCGLEALKQDVRSLVGGRS